MHCLLKALQAAQFSACQHCLKSKSCCVQYNRSVDVSVGADLRPSSCTGRLFCFVFVLNYTFNKKTVCFLLDHIYYSRNESLDSSHKGETAALEVKLFVFL